MDNDRTFGSIVRGAREAKGISQRELAKAVGINHTYISKIESETMGPPSEDTIVAIAKVLGLDGVTLIYISGKIPERHRNILLCNPALWGLLDRLDGLTGPQAYYIEDKLKNW